MAGFSPSTYAILNKKLKSVATGVKNIAINSTDPSKIDFTLNDNTIVTLTIPNSNVFVSKFSSLPTIGKNNVIYICKEDDGDNKKGVYVWNSTDNKYQNIGSQQSAASGDAVLEEDVTANVDVGNTKSGYKFKKNMTFTEYVKAVHVTYLKPVISTLIPTATNYEIGETITPFTVSATVAKKSNDIASVKLYLNSTLLKEDTTLTSGGTISQTNVDPSTNDTTFTIKCVVDDGKGGNTKTNTFNFYRKAFYGCDSVNNTAYTTSAEVRALSNNILNPKAGSNFKINIPVGAKMVVIAVPNTRTLKSVKYIEGMSSEVKDIFVKSTVNVEGANLYTGIDYNVYTYIPVQDFPSACTYDVTLN